MSCMPSVSQVEFSRQAKAPQPTWRALLRQRATSAVGTENEPSAGDPTVGSLGITAHSLSSLHKSCQGFNLKNAINKRGFHTLDIMSLGANSDLTGDWTPYNSVSQTLFGTAVLFSWQGAILHCLVLFSRAWMNGTRNTKEFPENCWRACRHT